MGRLIEVITPLHKKATRDYLGRMKDEKIECSKVAREYGKEFWDGDRRYGYGGYKYDGRWKPVAERFIETYGLKENSSILDVGCGKGYLLYELKKLLLKAKLAGFDVSEYAIQNAKEEIKENIFVRDAKDPLPYADNEFDLVISGMTIYNLPIFDFKTALCEIERVGKNKYISMESYRSVEELFNLQCWALTCELFFLPEEWVWLFAEFGYTGDYEFIYFE